jgi:RPA family protein
VSADGRPRREVAYRVFAAEYDDASHAYKQSDEERAPNYVVTPGGARVNRLFVVGVLTEVERVGDDEVLRARVVDPTGAFVVYAGQYQPEALAELEDADPPTFVAVTGKANTFTPEDSDRTFTSIRPESVAEVDADTRDRWVVETAEQTIDRVGRMAAALDRTERGEDLEAALSAGGLPPHLAAGIPRAIQVYGTQRAYLGGLRRVAVDALRQVAGDLDEVPSLTVDPDDASESDVDLAAGVEATSVGVSESAVSGGDAEAVETEPDEPEDVTRTETEVDPSAGGVQEPVGTDTEAGAPAADEPAGAPGETVETATAETDSDTSTPDASGPGTSEPADEDEMYELDADEREAVEEEYGVEFSSGGEIPDAGEADIETPEVEADADGDDDPDASGDDDTAEDLEDAVVETMHDVGDGAGVERDALIEAVTDRRQVDAAAVEEAIQAALMSGRCYESGDDELTPI